MSFWIEASFTMELASLNPNNQSVAWAIDA